MQQYSLRMKSYRSFPKNDNSLSQVARFRQEKIKAFKALRSGRLRRRLGDTIAIC